MCRRAEIDSRRREFCFLPTRYAAPYKKAAILVKILETLVAVSPFPNVDLGITVVSVLQNTRGSTLGREKAHFTWENSVK